MSRSIAFEVKGRKTRQKLGLNKGRTITTCSVNLAKIETHYFENMQQAFYVVIAPLISLKLLLKKKTQF